MVLRVNYVRPVSADQLRANVRHALTLGLPCVDIMDERPERLHIYASGPSLRTADLQQPSMALNGSLAVLVSRGHVPTWWVGCDPQAIVASFIGETDPTEGYIAASRCHPDVFAALSGRNVTLWHLADEGAEEIDDAILIPDAVSVTISALFLAHMMGFRAVTVHGWDGCYAGDVSHASGADDGKKRIEVKCCGKSFVTNPSWLVEREDAALALAMLYHMDIEIAGDGFMATALRPMIDETKKARAA